MRCRHHVIRAGRSEPCGEPTNAVDQHCDRCRAACDAHITIVLTVIHVPTPEQIARSNAAHLN